MKKSNRALCAGLWVIVAVAIPCAGRQQYRRLRGEGLYECVSANTPGAGNVQISGRTIGFIWDDPDTVTGIRPFVFGEVRAQWGILPFASLQIDSRLLSYFFNRRPQFGTLGGALRITLPDNSDLRVHGFGLELKYMRSYLSAFPSIAGYRVGGSGFSPEGFLVQGACAQARLLYELDLIAVSSAVPLKAMANAGARVPLEKWLAPYAQYLLSLGIVYAGLTFDAFAEISMEGFFNHATTPKRFDWDLGGYRKVWEIGFTENPILFTPGVRVRYEGGSVLYCAVPLLLSDNVGSSMTAEDKVGLDRGKFPEEASRGITDPFDPWYVKWRIVGEITIPLLYRETGAEMRRDFLLMKNRTGDARIELDRIRLEETSSDPDGDNADRERRLKEIRRRKEELRSSE